MPIFQGRKSAFRRFLDTLTGESIPLQHIRRKIQGKQKKKLSISKASFQPTDYWERIGMPSFEMN